MMKLKQKRILLVDDNVSIHDDFIKALNTNPTNVIVDEDEAILFNKEESNHTEQHFVPYKIESAYSGKEALGLVKKAVSEGHPYALVFVDMLMPPGWNGIETIQHLWKTDPELQVVICSAYSDFSWEEITRQLNGSDNVLILKKPFEAIEICQLAAALTLKWEQKKQIQFQIDNLQALVKERTRDLEASFSLTEATLESTEEGIIVINNKKEVVKYNKLFLKIFDISNKEIRSFTLEALFNKVASKLEEPVLFLRAMEHLETHTATQRTKEWKLRSGDILELYTNAQYLNGEIVGTVLSFRDITERYKLQEQLLYQSTHDSLTDLPNRILLADRTQQAILYAKRYNLLTAFLLLDIDNFKQVNDTFGHKVGDELLKEVAEKLKSIVRENSTVARLGGDEFVILLDAQSSEEHIEKIADKILNAFSMPCQLEDQQVMATFSIGISVYPKGGEHYDELMKNADIALYYAKGNGKNVFNFYQPELNENFLHKSELETSLHHALAKNELVLYYQPLIGLNSRKIMGFEALVRWNHPTLGLIPPNHFIPLAEKTNLIVPIGEWVLRTACSQIQAWQKFGSPALGIAVNVSKIQFQRDDFVDLVRKVLAETKLAPELLEIEITENLIITNFSKFLAKMKQLKELGVQLVVDDFGTGYSNLSYLRYFPFDKVKIDKIFIDEIKSEGNESCIVEAIINMSQKMGLTVVAEGVEKKEQVNYLRDLHGDQVQGYYFSEPLNADACQSLLSQVTIDTHQVTQEIEKAKQSKSKKLD